MVNVNKMDKFYEDANDQHVRATFVYTDDTYVYADEAKTIKIDGATLEVLFLKGEIVLAAEGSYSRAIGCEIDGEVVSVKFVGDVTLKSAEYTG